MKFPSMSLTAMFSMRVELKKNRIHTISDQRKCSIRTQMSLRVNVNHHIKKKLGSTLEKNICNMCN